MATATIAGLPLFQAVIDNKETGMQCISLVDLPAVERNFQAFDKDAVAVRYKVEDEEQRLVLGVVMRADFPIYRRSDEMGEFYIIYSKDTIRQMAEKYLADGKQNIVNLNHEEGTEVEGVEMVQWFIKDTQKGINPEGFDAEDGSLFAEFHVLNDEVWAAIKEGTYKGFSLEGYFGIEPVEMKSNFRKNMRKTLTTALNVLAKLVKDEFKMGSIATDKAVLHWDGEEDLKAGDAVYIVDEEGGQKPAEDGEYLTEDQKTIIVADGKVAEIKDPEAEVEPEEVPAPLEEEMAGEEGAEGGEEGGEPAPAPEDEPKPDEGKKDLEKRVEELENLVSKMADWMGIVVMRYNAIAKTPATKGAMETFRSEAKTADEKADYLTALAQAKRK